MDASLEQAIQDSFGKVAIMHDIAQGRTAHHDSRVPSSAGTSKGNKGGASLVLATRTGNVRNPGSSRLHNPAPDCPDNHRQGPQGYRRLDWWGYPRGPQGVGRRDRDHAPLVSRGV